MSEWNMYGIYHFVKLRGLNEKNTIEMCTGGISLLAVLKTYAG